MNHSQMPTLLDVAKKAGVSRSTASNAFSRPDVVRAEVREKIAMAALELGYLGPDPKAKLLRHGKVNAIGIVPPGEWGVADSLRNPVYHQFLLGVAETCDEVGANLVIIPDRTSNGGVRTALVDGFIFGRIEHLRETEPARLRRLPFVVMDADAGPDISSVHVDARKGGYLAARHLIELGHRKFGIMSFLRGFGPTRYHPPGVPRGPEAAGMETDQEKLRGYAEALGEAGLDIAEVPMVQAQPWDRDAAKMMLDAAPEATAILSMAVMQGIAVLDEARRRGLSVPRDLSVVGFNEIPEAAKSTPSLTTVDGKAAEKGRMAARIVFDAGPIRRELLQPRLIVRSSTAPPSKG
jgi:DNA-binding LacI/PurR family transcriptional regulator